MILKKEGRRDDYATTALRFSGALHTQGRKSGYDTRIQNSLMASAIDTTV